MLIYLPDRYRHQLDFMSHHVVVSVKRLQMTEL